MSRTEEVGRAGACEQQIRRIGRRLQAVGQLLDQNPRRLIPPDCEGATAGPSGLLLDVAELHALLDPSNPNGVSQLLCRYHSLAGTVSGAETGDEGAGEKPS